MRMNLALFTILVIVFCAASAANAVVIIGGSTNNGNLDRTYAQVVVDNAPAGAGPEDFYLPKPQIWQNVGTRAIGGPYEDDMSSEPWAGPAPTPVTTDGLLNPPSPEGCNGADCGLFFKPFSGGTANGAATAHLFQDNPATPGFEYTLTGWAGAEPNALMQGAEFALEFLNGGGGTIGGATINLLPTLFVNNDEPFDYKQYTVSAIAPAGTTTVRARASMIDALGNPAGGGQAFVVDDFTLTGVPEPASLGLLALAIMPLAIRRFR